ncbi:MAG TPA: DUF4129 domain-containing protein [Ktedonobacteraceae bacterium]|nr:DUF4129 domain-containing protein [Ktedonobacteraceae bacterium]
MDESQTALAAPQRPAPARANSADMPARTTFGERLLPLLVMGMECCLVYALLLVMAGFFAGQDDPLLPIWALFLVVLFFYGLSHGLKRFVDQWPESELPWRVRRLLVALPMGSAVLVILVVCLWLRFYAARFALFDPAWLQALNHDAGAVEWDMQLLVLGGLFALLSWLSYQKVRESSNAALFLRKAMPLLLILIGVSLGEGLLGSSAHYWQAVLLLPAFVWPGLLAQALQKASAKRRYHTATLANSTRHQERIIFQALLALGLVIAAALIGALFVSGRISVSIPEVTPMPAPAIQFTSPLKGPPPPQHAGLPQNFPHVTFPTTSAEMALLALGTVIASGAILFLLISSLYALAKYGKRRRLRQRKRAQKKGERQSVWSWRLFWRQCGAFVLQQGRALLLLLLALWRSFRRQPAAVRPGAASGSGHLFPAPSEVRTIRDIYQAFLAQASSRGYPRASNETPYEFRRRLQSQQPLLEPELEAITEAYAQARYGGHLPPTDEFARLHEIWRRLSDKWRKQTSSS